jgi:hypothetical protein
VGIQSPNLTWQVVYEQNQDNCVQEDIQFRCGHGVTDAIKTAYRECDHADTRKPDDRGKRHEGNEVRLEWPKKSRRERERREQTGPDSYGSHWLNFLWRLETTPTPEISGCLEAAINGG